MGVSPGLEPQISRPDPEFEVLNTRPLMPPLHLLLKLLLLYYCCYYYQYHYHYHYHYYYYDFPKKILNIMFSDELTGIYNLYLLDFVLWSYHATVF